MRRLIGDVLERWPFSEDGFSFRMIQGDDGRDCLQVRVDLGLLQLELSDRPDGRLIQGFPTQLDQLQAELAGWQREHGTDRGFHLSPTDCDKLRREAMQVYQRYVGLHALGRYRDVVRDTARNLAVCDFVNRYATDEDDRWSLEQFRPYITMMKAVAQSHVHTDRFEYEEAEQAINDALSGVRAFAMQNFGRINVGHELEILRHRLSEVRRERPRSEADLVQRQLDAAVDREDYEAAARLRDRLTMLAGEPPAALRE